MKEGVNPNKISKIIRNDEIEQLQEISSRNDFDFNQCIKPSLYERYSLVDGGNVTLIDYAAFYSSIKCFKYLLMNGANVNNTGKYAAAGGSEEIIHLCEQNHSSFEDACETAIKFHRNDIFKYIYDKKLEQIKLGILGEVCILYDNYNILSFLEKEGLKINKTLIIDSMKTGNIFIFLYFKEKASRSISLYLGEVPSFCGNKEFFGYLINLNYFNNKKNLLHLALNNIVEEGHTEVAKLLLEQDGVDINIVVIH